MGETAREMRLLVIFFVQLSARRKLVRRVSRQNEILIPDGLERSIGYETSVLTAGQPESFLFSSSSFFIEAWFLYFRPKISLPAALQTRRKSLKIPMGETFFKLKED